MPSARNRSDALVDQLAEFRRQAGPPRRLRSKAEELANGTLALLFPQFSDFEKCEHATIQEEIDCVKEVFETFDRDLRKLYPDAPMLSGSDLLEALINIHVRLVKDAEAIFEGDPAAESIDEVVLAYPGFLAIALYRIANHLFQFDYPLLPRLITEYGHRQTGIDIHPGATIGEEFFIDHGTGVVIGETSHIGNRVKIYQGVTLGALSVEKKLAHVKRHPTIEDDVVIYSNATILGGQTVIGKGSVIGGNAWLTSSIPPNSVVTRGNEVRAKKSDDGLEFHI